MTHDNDFYTETMARVYSSQGYWEKAAEIYRYLLRHEPDRQDLADKLSEIEKHIHIKKNTGKEHLVALFNQWMDLVLKHNQLKQLKKVSQSVSHHSRNTSDE